MTTHAGDQQLANDFLGTGFGDRFFQADFGRVAASVERAILSLGDVGRVRLYRWGDGGAHLHVGFLPRPLGMLEASGMALPLWEDVLPNVPDEERVWRSWPAPTRGAGHAPVTRSEAQLLVSALVGVDPA